MGDSPCQGRPKGREQREKIPNHLVSLWLLGMGMGSIFSSETGLGLFQFYHTWFLSSETNSLSQNSNSKAPLPTDPCQSFH